MEGKQVLELLEREKKLNEIGVALSVEPNTEKLLEKILEGAKELTHADGGTIYTITAQNTLAFRIVWTDSLNYRLGGTFGKSIPFQDLPLFVKGQPNDKVMSACAVNQKKAFVVHDAYNEEGFDFSAARRFDEETGYRTKSVLSVPIATPKGEVIAALQLINPIEPTTKNVREFTEDDIFVVQSLASQAGVALANQMLIHELKELFESFIRVIAEAVDEKSPSTGGHNERVPILTELLAQAVNETEEGPLKEVSFSDSELYELKVATFLHDCGKVTTPEHVIEKSKKLETVWDRIELLDTRFEVLKRDAEIELLRNKLSYFKAQAPHLVEQGSSEFQTMEREYDKTLGQINSDQQFLQRCNSGTETISQSAKNRIKGLGEQVWKLKDRLEPLLRADEIENLSVPQGNLTTTERSLIEKHVVMTIRMLSALSYPKDLAQVPAIAGAHHERVDGKGYPKGLTKEQIPLRARILSVADVFEALSAPDRPYKSANKLSETLAMMRQMCGEGQLDPDVFDVFVKKKVYLTYGQANLTQEQLDID